MSRTCFTGKTNVFFQSKMFGSYKTRQKKDFSYKTAAKVILTGKWRLNSSKGKMKTKKQKSFFFMCVFYRCKFVGPYKWRLKKMKPLFLRLKKSASERSWRLPSSPMCVSSFVVAVNDDEDDDEVSWELSWAEEREKKKEGGEEEEGREELTLKSSNPNLKGGEKSI